MTATASATHERELAIACPSCLAPEGVRCAGTKASANEHGIVAAHPHRERTLASLTLSHGWAKPEQPVRTVRAIVDRLLEITKISVSEVSANEARPWEAGSIALRWIQYEIAPLILEIEAKKDEMESTTGLCFPKSCPFCEIGEGWTPTNWTSVISFSCGHTAKPDHRGKPQENAVLRINSDTRIPSSAQICVRPQSRDLHPKRFIIQANPERWIVEDFRIGNSSQFKGGGNIPGEAFAMSSELRIDMQICTTAMDVTVSVIYVGPDPDGEVFDAMIYGIEVADDRFTPAMVPAETFLNEQHRRVNAEARARSVEDAYANRERAANAKRVDDGVGGCSICKASQAMWCDAIEHQYAHLYRPPHHER